MAFEQDTYIVLDMPPAWWSEHITALRKKYDPDRAELPIEITVIGSSGVGVFENDQDMIGAFQIIDKLASQIAPITFRFKSVAKFPNTNLYYYSPADPAPFVNIQNRIVATGLKFKTSPYPFTPHCTIADLGNNITESARNEIVNLTVPTNQIMIDELKVYSLNGTVCNLLYLTKMRG